MCLIGDTFTGSLHQGWDASIRGRFGVPINYSRTLIYATGGVAFGHVSGSFGYAASFTPTAQCPLTGGNGTCFGCQFRLSSPWFGKNIDPFLEFEAADGLFYPEIARPKSRR